MTSPDEAVIYNTRAIVLRRTEYGDHDYILTCLTRDRGKLQVMARNAKKSVKRFSGVLELFYAIDMVIRESRSMAYLLEASVSEPFAGFRGDILKTAYAAYFSETMIRFLEERVRQERMYDLLHSMLDGLAKGIRPPDELSVLFHLRFLALSGHEPELAFCLICKKKLDDIRHVRIFFDIRQGGLICQDCGKPSLLRIPLAKGTLKQLLWFQKAEPEKSSVIRFSKRSLNESLEFLEQFLGFHLEKELGSLKFLNRIRTSDDIPS